MTPYTNLTDEQIDRLVAERVMGWTFSESIGWVKFYKDGITGGVSVLNRTWQPSAIFDHAKEAVENCNFHIFIRYDPVREKNKWTICGHDGKRVMDTDNPARAICIALLEAEEGK